MLALNAALGTVLANVLLARAMQVPACPDRTQYTQIQINP